MIVRKLSSQGLLSATTLLRFLISVGLYFCVQVHAANNITNHSDKSVSGYLESDSQATIFVTALKESGLWGALQNTDPVTLFVPTNQALHDEGSAFLLEVVLSKAENKDRFHNTMSAHVYRSYVRLDDETDRRIIKDSNGGCLAVTSIGGLVKVGPEASVVSSVEAKDGAIYFVDHLLWAPYKDRNTCM